MDDAGPPEILGVIADPLRWRLVSELARSDRRVGELVERVCKPQNLVSYHLGELRRVGIVRARRSSADRRDMYYSVDLIRCRDLLASAAIDLHPALQLTPAPPRSLHRRHRPQILFLCTGNSARSQMAEALLEHRAGQAITARSAGSHPKPLHPHAVRVMAERAIDISSRTSKPLTQYTRTRFDRVVTLCDKVREICPEFAGAPTTTHWSIADPATEADDGDGDEAGCAAFRRVADEIEGRVDVLLTEITTQPPRRRSHA